MIVPHIIGWLSPPTLPEQIAYTALFLSDEQREALLKAACFLLASTVRVWWMWHNGKWIRL